MSASPWKKLEEQFFEKEIRKQLLIVPETLELTLAEAQTVLEHLSDLDKMGFSLEPAGDRAFLGPGGCEGNPGRTRAPAGSEGDDRGDFVLGKGSGPGPSVLGPGPSACLPGLASRPPGTLRAEEALSLLEQLQKCVSPRKMSPRPADAHKNFSR